MPTCARNRDGLHAYITSFSFHRSPKSQKFSLPFLQSGTMRLTKAELLAHWPMRSTSFDAQIEFLILSTKPHPVPEMLARHLGCPPDSLPAPGQAWPAERTSLPPDVEPNMPLVPKRFCGSCFPNSLRPPPRLPSAALTRLACLQ